MKKVIYIPKTNVISLNRTINTAFRGYPIYLSWEDIYTKDLRNINIVSEYIIKMKESFNRDNKYKSSKEDYDRSSFNPDLDNPDSKSEDEQRNREIDDEENMNDNPESDI